MAKKPEPENIDTYELPKAVPMVSQVPEKIIIKQSELDAILDDAKTGDLAGLGYELGYAIDRFTEARNSFLLRISDLAVDADDETLGKIEAIKDALR